jgi:hypothetical protein
VKLYHLTREKHLPSIAEHGLLPTIGQNIHMTFNIPAVWLSANPYPDWTLHYHADACLLTVEPRKKRLFHWRTWMAGIEVDQNGEIFRGADALAALDRDEEFPANSDNYYVHLGIILPSRIKDVARVNWCGGNEAAEAAIREHQEELQQHPWGAA